MTQTEQPSESKDLLGDRMKGYEQNTRFYLSNKTPTIIRLDGKAFHTFTAMAKKPFDDWITLFMQETMRYLVNSIQGTVFGYTQSDEISLILSDAETDTTQGWFGWNLQKMASVSAAMASTKFNQLIYTCADTSFESPNDQPALFDSRVFQVPTVEEVVNYLIWRQKDCERNAWNSLAQTFFSHKQLQGKKLPEVQEIITSEKFKIPGNFEENVLGAAYFFRHDKVKKRTSFTDPVIRGYLTNYLLEKFACITGIN